MNQAIYEQQYARFFQTVPALVQKLTEEGAGTIKRVAENDGEDAVQALFDAIMDNGHRAVLVKALNSPSLPEWVRDKLNVFLYGGSHQKPVLLFKLH